MTELKRGLVDTSSVLWTSLMAGKDKEFGREVPNEAGDKMVWVNSAEHCISNALNHLIFVMDQLKLVPRQMIFVVEGQNSKSERQGIHPGYKAGRDKVPAQYEEFNKAKAQLLELFRNLGALIVSQDGVEADDVLGYLAQKLKGEVWIISYDKDLAQCVGGNVHHIRDGKFDRNPFGDFPLDLIPVYIALVGDSQDKIPGAKGFGDGAWNDMHAVFGDDGLKAMELLIKGKKLEALEEDVGELKILQKVIDDRKGVYMSYELGRLRTERVNTMRRPLKWTPGMVKDKSQIWDDRLRKFGGTVTLVSQENYGDALDFFKKHLLSSPEVALDIETSTPPKSDEWLERLGKSEDKTPVDVFGSDLTGMSLTFGRNMQHTIYITVDHKPERGVTNVSPSMVAEMLEKIPRGTHIVCHNAAFELPVCFMSFGKRWEHDPLYHGFLPNVIDTRIMSSYVDENRSAGLKGLSKDLLDYEQESYEQVTTVEWHEAEWIKAGSPGKLLGHVPADESGHGGAESFVRVQHKMNELTANHVLSYGADDAICTAALSNYFRVIMEIEDTWDVFMEIEQFPAYLTAKAFVDGVDFSLETMAKMEKEDDVTFDKAWVILRSYLISIGFDGTQCPTFTEFTPAAIKEAHLILTGRELKTLVRTPDKLAKLIEQQAEGLAHEDRAFLLADAIKKADLSYLNQIVQTHFKGEPELDLASSKQMTRLLYDHMKLPVHIINDCTALEKQNKPELFNAIKKFKRKRAGHDSFLDEDDLALVRTKARADDTAIEYALAFDADLLSPEAQAALHAIGRIKAVMTRRSLFYKNYWVMRHWKDGKIHASVNQCAAVTRRYSSSNPNLQQLPKKGEGVKFRACFLPHEKDAVVCSIDFSGQELRIAAERSQDKNMLACYIGDNKKDIHSITAAGAMQLKWGVAAVKELMQTYGADIDPGIDADYELFCRLRDLPKSDPWKKKADDHRKNSKNVNFAAQFGGQAAKIAETEIMELADAQLFLDARNAMFPDVEKAAERAEEFCKKYGYALTMMGARRHLQAAMLGDDSWAISRAARQAWNMEVQGSATEMVKLAMTRFWKSGAIYKYRARFIAPIHDELVTSVHKDDALEFIKIKHECMTGQYANMGNPNDPKSVPILGSISLGKNFADQIECGDWYIADNIKKALNDIFHKEAVAA